MPLPGARYRTIRTKKGPVRLAWQGRKVVETKNLRTGATHTPEEFHQDALRRARRGRLKRRR